MTIMVKVSREDTVDGVVDITVLNPDTTQSPLGKIFFGPKWEKSVMYSLLEPASSITIPVYDNQKLLVEERKKAG